MEATKTINLMDSEIPAMVVMNMRERCGYQWYPERCGDLYNIIFSTIAAFLKRNASKKDPSTGVALKDNEGEFIIGGVLNYTAPEDGSDEDNGNYNLVFISDPKDFEDIEVTHMIIDYEREFFVQAEREAFDLAGGRWKSVGMMWQIFRVMVDTLREYLNRQIDDNPGSVIEVSLPGVITARAATEDNEKIIEFIPGGSVKEIIKSDKLL